MRYSIEDFLNVRTATASNFSPDGSRLLVFSNLTGTMQLYRVPRTGGELTQLTDYDEPVAGAYLPTTDEILLAMDEGGNERTQLYLLDGDGGNRRVIAEDPEHMHTPGGVTRDGKTLAYASNRRTFSDFDVYVHDLASGNERCVFDMGGWCGAVGFSPDGQILAVQRLTERNSDNDLYVVDLRTDEVRHISPHDGDALFGAPSWTPDGSAFYFVTNLDREFSAIARYDVRAASWDYVIEGDWDLNVALDWTGTRLIVRANEDGWLRATLHDPGTLAPLGDMPMPGRGWGSGSMTHDGSALALSFTSAVEPGDVWVHDFDGDGLRRVTTSPNPIPTETFVEPELHRFPSFDGESIPVFVYRPRDADGPVPVVVVIHGGPESQYVPTFSPVVQYLVHRGYAVAAPNVRGSTGYGKRFHHLDDQRKRLDSVRDLEGLYGWLRAQPHLDHTRAALWGGSYGGYMVLAGLAFQPELWAAGVDIVGISSLVTFLENTSAWRRRFREREYGWLDTDRDFLIEASPITHVERMRAPLFIIHGANDVRVPLGEAEQLHRVLADKGVPCELLVYQNEGHGLGKLKNRLDAYPKAVDFLDRALRR